MKPVVQEWMELAQIDLKAAALLISNPDLTSTVCFHSQQCTEKCLKAIIESKGVNPPKTHDLIRLYGMVEDIVDFDEDILAQLNEVYIDSRYPAGLGFLPDGAPTVEEAKSLMEYAEAVYQTIHKKLAKLSP